MERHYCPTCSNKRKLIPKLKVSKFVESIYQLDKFHKHTKIDSRHNEQGIFFDKSTEAFHENMISAQNSGSVEIDKQGRLNVLLFVNSLGIVYEKGLPKANAEVFKAVLTDISTKVHAFPDATVHYENVICDDCGKMFLPKMY